MFVGVGVGVGLARALSLYLSLARPFIPIRNPIQSKPLML
jgi:hypothetical protein